MNKTILITGGAGFIGTKLTEKLLDLGYKVIICDVLVPKITHKNLSFDIIDVSKTEIPKKYEGKIDAVIHLAGKNIFGKWTTSFKKDIYDSRINSTRQIVQVLNKWQQKPEVFISASAFGFYGDKKDDLVNEDAIAGTDFLAKVCKDWEQEARGFTGARSVQIRTALVLGNKGLLAPLFIPFKFGLGAWIGEGKAWFPWVHIEDIIGIYIFALENKNVIGPINTNAPEQIRQKEFMKLFGTAMHRKVLFSIPIFILRFQYGDLADTFNNSVKMSSDKIQKLGYVFKHPKAKQALENIIMNKK